MLVAILCTLTIECGHEKQRKEAIGDDPVAWGADGCPWALLVRAYENVVSLQKLDWNSKMLTGVKTGAVLPRQACLYYLREEEGL